MGGWGNFSKVSQNQCFQTMRIRWQKHKKLRRSLFSPFIFLKPLTCYCINLKKFKFLEPLPTYRVSSRIGEDLHATAHTHDSNSCRHSLLRDIHLSTAATWHWFGCWGNAQQVWCCTAYLGKSKHCTVFVTGSSSQHGEMHCYYCCSVQNTDTHDLWTKLSQAKSVQHPRRWGMNHCPLLKTRKKANLLYKFLYIFPAYCFPPWGCPADPRLQCPLLVSLVYKQDFCVAPDIWVEVSYTHPYISIDTGCSVKHSGSKKSYLTPTQNWTGQIYHWLLPCHHYWNRPTWRRVKTLFLSLSVQWHSY